MTSEHDTATPAAGGAYTGRVTVGGPADTRALPGLMVTKVAVGPMNNNAYLLRCPTTGEQLLIDAANEPGTLLTLIGDAGLATVVTSHRHSDHVQALAEVVAATGATTVAHADDAAEIPVPTARIIHDGDGVTVGRATLRAIHLVGHTPGSVALLYDADPAAPHLFTGDCLFPGGPGRTTTPDEFTSLMDDLERKVFGPLPDETWVYPGHGWDSTIGAERPHLAEWRARGW
ncbi:Zn-dependent hydrolase, glyoxylase [Frankia canadensis]|uniref:Zn-dependent hydrolase, glyoxylase n=1 Tax=Frankia canadensis TaxID=1836972 RepID=A0A2I2KN55_9ACTN|nr:MBL fold metallo-hydrolase [Frankia canadensis]SNQ47095.1 Zn-dependent hydrolase, glyoxylase [Frankia canadensis]SOU54385.1 Zn-dependent hydrolase, glyoxylase [Frankia canadensis]